MKTEQTLKHLPLANNREALQQDFCQTYNLTPEQFFGTEKIKGSLYLGSYGKHPLPEGFNPTVGGSLDLSSYGKHPLPPRSEKVIESKTPLEDIAKHIETYIRQNQFPQWNYVQILSILNQLIYGKAH